MASEMIYTAVHRLWPGNPEKWNKYLEWSGVTGVEEIVSFDDNLCPEVIQHLEDEDWKHNIQEDGQVFFFRDLDYLLRRVADFKEVNILGLIQNPDAPSELGPSNKGFEFCGFDLMDPWHSISVFSDCGDWPGFISRSSPNRMGLVPDLKAAWQLRDLWNNEYPDPGHSPCTVWGLWRLRR